MIQIEYRREGQINAASAQFGAHHETASGSRVGGTHGAGAWIVVSHSLPELSQYAHGRQKRKAIGLEALHAPTFVIHHDGQIPAYVFYLATQGAELLAVAPVACKQNHATHHRMAQARDV